MEKNVESLSTLTMQIKQGNKHTLDAMQKKKKKKKKKAKVLPSTPSTQLETIVKFFQTNQIFQSYKLC